MDVVFQEKTVDCLQEQAAELLYQEETTELIVPDSYPDIRNVVCGSAVGCVRGREQTGGAVTVSGTFHARVLYTAEEENLPGVLEAWLPFSAKASAEALTPDAEVIAELRIRSVDTRILNSRKLLIRVGYAVRIVAYGKNDWKIKTAEQTETLQLLNTEETGLFPIAAAGKTLTHTETLRLQQAGTEIRRLVRVVPEIRETECRFADGQAVWKGVMQLHTVYLTEDGTVGVFDTELPISQLVGLDTAEEDCTLRAVPLLTELQTEQEDGGSFALSFSVRIQIVAWKRLTCSLITDGYAVGAELEAAYQPYRFCDLLDTPTKTQTVEATLQGSVRKLIDCAALVDFPVCRRGDGELTVSAGVALQALYYDEQGRLGGETVRGESEMTFALHSGAFCLADAAQEGTCWASVSGAERTVACSVALSARCFSETVAQGMTAASVGEETRSGAERPSLIVRRVEPAEKLWEIARQAGTTVRAIREANGLSGEPQEKMLLLIPTR